MSDIKDFTIIGGGPTGLFAAFYGGMRGMSTRIVDSLPELGGQLTALYPEKYIYDVGGYPRVLAKDLAAGLVEQAMQFEPELSLDDEVREIHGSGTVEEVTVFDNRTDEDKRMPADAVLTFLGFKPDLGPIKEWGLELEKNRIRVNPLMETNIPGIYGAGDIVTYQGKLDLIATGFAEAAVAANNAARFVNPDARVNPGHSTSLAVFKDK